MDTNDRLGNNDEMGTNDWLSTNDRIGQVRMTGGIFLEKDF